MPDLIESPLGKERSWIRRNVPDAAFGTSPSGETTKSSTRDDTNGPAMRPQLISDSSMSLSCWTRYFRTNDTFSDQWIFGPMGLRTNGFSDQWNFFGPEPSDQWHTFSDQWFSDQWHFFGPMGCRTIETSPPPSAILRNQKCHRPILMGQICMSQFHFSRYQCKSRQHFSQPNPLPSALLSPALTPHGR